VVFWDPRTRRLQAGILESFVRPPATPELKKIYNNVKIHFYFDINIFAILYNTLPIILAAVDAPTIIDKFGAINAILLSTYSNIFDLQLFNSTAISQASQIASLSSSVNN